MNKKVVFVGISLLVTLFVATGVYASNMTFATPLFTLRMEQQSHEMNFLPTEINEFTYTAEMGHTLSYDAGCCNVSPLDIEPTNEQNLCEYTVDTSCPDTCLSTCPDTCVDTCPSTCQGNTCEGSTCGDPPC